MFARRFDQLPAFPNIVANRLFDIDVLAGLNGPNRAEGMPMVGRGKSNHINVLVLEQLADVGITFELGAMVAGSLYRAIQDMLIDIAQRHQPGAFDARQLFDVVLAATVEA